MQLGVYDASGRIVKPLVSRNQQPGRYAVTWDGTDARNRTAGGGVCFYRLDMPGFGEVKKAVIVR